MTVPANTIIQGNVIDVLQTLPPACVDAVVTSPPYWALRDYNIEGQVWGGEPACTHQFGRHGFCGRCPAWRGQLGLEPDFELFLDHLCSVFDGIRRVLKPSGTCWVNLGDTYSGSGNGSDDSRSCDWVGRKPQQEHPGQKAGKTTLPEKCLMQIPSRFALELCRRGWILRNEIIWHKPNCVPSSVRDRFALDFEKLFLFVRSKHYFFDVDAVREPHDEYKRLAGLRRARDYGYDGEGSYRDWYFNRRRKTDWVGGVKTLSMGMHATRGKGRNKPPLIHPLGRSKRSIWSIPTKPFPGAHFAVYPAALVEIPIKAGCPKGGLVLDPFMGSGTTALVALELGRNFLGIELKGEYVRMACERIGAWHVQQKLAA